MRRALVVAGTAALLFPGGAVAHATLTSTAPAFKERVERAPTRVVLRFTQRIEVLPNSVSVRDDQGRIFSRAPRPTPDGRGLEAPLRPLPRGGYSVRWRTLSIADGHVVSGVFTFGVRAPAPEPTAAFGSTGPTTGEKIVRWLYFLGLALFAGALAFRLLVLPRTIPAPVARRLYLLSGLGALGAIDLGVAAFVLRGEAALQLSLGDLLYGDLSPIAGGTRFGSAFIAMTLGLAGASALLAAGWLTDRRAFLWAALATSLVFAYGLTYSSHQAAEPNSTWLSQLADWVHLCAALLWVGGLINLVVVFRSAPELRRQAFLRFARLATGLVALVLAGGVYLSFVRLPAASDLWRESYGRVLLVKLALVSCALAFGAFHQRVVRPRFQRQQPSFRISPLATLTSEGTVVIAVLLVAAVLVNSPPPDVQPTTKANAATVVIPEGALQPGRSEDP